MIVENHIRTLESTGRQKMHSSTIQTREYPDHSTVLASLSRAFSNEPLTKAITQSVHILRESSDHFDWVGIYLVRNNDLVLEAYAGDEETEHVRIQIGQGICGAAAKEGETIVVSDVSQDPRYLMCFPFTRSEIVVPIKGLRGVLGEIDIDSSRLSAFNQSDRELLEQAASLFARRLET
jgi:L-methionine (R)-S-oxide reductase